MKPNQKIQIPNILVYATLYAVVFGIGIWLLIAHKESPTNWLVYVGMIVAVLAGLIKFGARSRRRLSTH